MPASKRVHKHHCPACTFLGTIERKVSSLVPPNAKQIDLYGCDYVHFETDGRSTIPATTMPYYFVCARWGSDKTDVIVADCFGLQTDVTEAHIVEALRLYVAHATRYGS